MADTRPIIKKIKKKAHAAHHGGAWKVAYADFVTAMMAFFLVMWIVGLSESTRRAIAGYFREPGVFEFLTTRGKPDRIEVMPSSSQRQGDGSGTKGAENDMMKYGRSGDEARQQQLTKLEKDVKDALTAVGAGNPEARLLLESAGIEITEEGLRIELTETRDLAYFDIGGSRPRKVAREVFAALAPTLASLHATIVIEGHTDTRAFVRGSQKTNWELSVERANAARKLLLENGVAESQLASVTGYGDRRLRKKESPLDAANRRVSLVVLPPEPESKL
jgi:chemotaxis protein MotB